MDLATTLSLMAQDGAVKGSFNFRGLKVDIENPRGSVRTGVDSDGKKWRTVFRYPYGYIRKTEGTDGDSVDVYIGPYRPAKEVYIIHQNRPDTGEYDEDKVMLGFKSAAVAKAAYLRHYNNPDFFRSLTTVSFDQFKKSLIEKKGEMLGKASQGKAF